jgi:hypothetical protein
MGFALGFVISAKAMCVMWVGCSRLAFVHGYVAISSWASFAFVEHFGVGRTSAKRAERPEDGPVGVSEANHPVTSVFV